MRPLTRITLMAVFLCCAGPAGAAETMDNYKIYRSNDVIGAPKVKYPSWFKESFLDLREDVREARATGKRGVIVFFSQVACGSCRAFIEATFGNPEIERRVRADYDVIGLDIFSDLEVTDVDGKTTAARDFIMKYRGRMTPTLVFYGDRPEALLRIVGFYPPEKFGRVLDFLDTGQTGKASLGEYLRDRTRPQARRGELQRDALFRPARSLVAASGRERPVLVLFDSPDCPACRRFHERVLTDTRVRELVGRFHAFQVDTSKPDVTLMLPDGRNTRVGDWIRELDLGYDVSMVFFAPEWKEVLRVDSEAGHLRAILSMEYVLERGYESEPQLQRWRRSRAIETADGGPAGAAQGQE